MVFQAILGLVFLAVSIAQLVKTQKVEGARKGDLSAPRLDYGAPIPTVHGTSPRLPGQPIVALPIEEVATTEKKGDIFGLGGTKVTTFDYLYSGCYMFCRSPAAKPVTAVRRVWINKILKLDFRASAIGGQVSSFSPRGDFFSTLTGLQNLSADDFQALQDVGGAVAANASALSGSIGSGQFRIYLGGDNQEPDPLYVAMRGSDAPAHNGVLTIWFENINEDDFGSPGWPEITAEIVRGDTGASAATVEDFPDLADAPWTIFDIERPVMWWEESFVITKVNRITGEILLSRNVSADINTAISDTIVYISGPAIIPDTGDIIVAVGDTAGANNEWLVALDGETLEVLDTVGGTDNFSFYQDGAVQCFPLGGGNYVVSVPDTQQFSETMVVFYNSTSKSFTSTIRYEQTLLVTTQSGWSYDYVRKKIYMFGANDWALTPRYVGRLDAVSGTFDYVTLKSTDLVFGPMFYDHLQEKLVFFQNNSIKIVNPETLAVENTIVTTINATYPATPDGDDAEMAVNQQVGIFGEAWVFDATADTAYLVDTITGATKQSFDFGAETPHSNVKKVVYDNEFDGFWFVVVGESHWRRVTRGRVDTDTRTLENILVDTAGEVGLASTFLDYSAGSSIAVNLTIPDIETAARTHEEMLLAYFLDLVEEDHKLVLKPLNRSSEVTVTDSLLIADGDDPKLPIIRDQDPERPETIYVSFFDQALDGQENTVSDRLLSGVSGANEPTDIKFNLLTTADHAGEIAQQALVGESLPFSYGPFRVMPSLMQITAGTILTVQVGHDGVTNSYQMHALEVTHFADFTTEIKAEHHSDFIHSPNVSDLGSVLTNAEDEVIQRAAPLEPVLADLPNMRGARDDDAGIYIRHKLVTPGDYDHIEKATIYRGTQGNFAAIGASQFEVLVGRALTVLPAPPFTEGGQIDDVSTVDVVIGDLDDSTLDGLFVGRNIISVGDEIIQFMTTTDQGGNITRLSGLLRGRFGTIAAADGHVSGERVVLWGDFTEEDFISTIHFGSADDVGTAFDFYAEPLGRTMPSYQTVTEAAQGNALKPRPPANATAIEESGGEVTLAWVRQDKLAPEWNNSTETVANSETVEKYEWDVHKVSDDSVLRTLSATDAVTVDYSAADQSTDSITSPTTEVYFIGYQLKGDDSRGYPTRKIIASIRA